jgi:hypothetical protein
MKRKSISIVLTVAALVCAGFAADSEKAQPGGGRATTLAGKVARKGRSSLTVLAVGVRPMSVNVRLNAGTALSLNGRVADLSGIRIGDSAVVKYVPLTGQVVNAINVEAHRHRLGTVNSVIDPTPPPIGYPYCPQVESGGTIPGTATPCYCNKCAGAGSGMVW